MNRVIGQHTRSDFTLNDPCDTALCQITLATCFSNQPSPQLNRTPYNQQQTFGHKEDNLGTLFNRNIMTVSKTPVNKHDNCQTANSQNVQFDTNYEHNIQRVLEVLEIFHTHDPIQHTKNTKKNLYPTRPNPTRGSTQPPLLVHSICCKELLATIVRRF